MIKANPHMRRNATDARIPQIHWIREIGESVAICAVSSRMRSMKLEDSTAYTAKCFRGEPASCSYACPFHMDIRSFLDKGGQGQMDGGLQEPCATPPSFPLSSARSAISRAEITASARCSETRRSPCATLRPPAFDTRRIAERNPTSYRPKTQRIAVVGAGRRPFLRAESRPEEIPGHGVRKGRTAGAASSAPIPASPNSTPI